MTKPKIIAESSRGLVGLAMGSLLLAGCTTELEVTPMNAIKTGPVAGWSYSLPFARYEAVITRRLVTCGVEGPLAGAGKDGRIETKIVAEQVFERDPARTYVIDHRALSSGWKTSALSIALHPEGMLKSINAEGKDATGEIVASVATGIASIASTLIAPGFPGPRGARDDRRAANVLPCTPKSLELIKRHDAAAEDVKAKTRLLNEQVATLKAWSAAAAASGNKFDKSMQQGLIDVAKEVSVRQAALEEATAALAKLTASLTDVRKLRWPGDGATFASKEMPIGTKSLMRWFGADPGVAVVRLALERSAVASVTPVAVGTDAATDGVRYRIPSKGRLVMCVDLKDTCTADAGKVVVEGSVPQLGQVQVLPYKNGPFQSNIMEASFGSDGSLLTASYSDRESAAANVAGSFSSLVDLAIATAADVDARRKGKSTAEKEAVEAETALIKARTDLENAKLAALPSPTADQERQTALLQADADLLTAEKAKIDAELALKEAREQAASSNDD